MPRRSTIFPFSMLDCKMTRLTHALARGPRRRQTEARHLAAARRLAVKLEAKSKKEEEEKNRKNEDEENNELEEEDCHGQNLASLVRPGPQLNIHVAYDGV